MRDVGKLDMELFSSILQNEKCSFNTIEICEKTWQIACLQDSCDFFPQTEAFCSTYNVDIFCVVYSAIDKSSFKAAEKILHYLKDNEMLLTRGAILVGNKTDLERHREITRQGGSDIFCRFCFYLIIVSSFCFAKRLRLLEIFLKSNFLWFNL